MPPLPHPTSPTGGEWALLEYDAVDVKSRCVIQFPACSPPRTHHHFSPFSQPLGEVA